jgi:hypothetical protein
VIAVGSAAKESVATWVRAHRGSANPDHLDNATLGGLPGRLRLVGVVHPGSASGWSTSAIKADFQRACNQVKGWLDADPGWLPTDPAMPRNLDSPSSTSRRRCPPRLPVRHLSAARPRRHLQQPHRRPAGYPTVLRPRRLQRRRRTLAGPLHRRRQPRRLRRRPRRPALRAPARRGDRLRPRPAEQPGAVPWCRRPDPQLPDPAHPAGGHPRPHPGQAQQPPRPAAGAGPAPRAAAARLLPEPQGARPARARARGAAPRGTDRAGRGRRDPARQGRHVRRGGLLAGGPGPARHPQLPKGHRQPHLPVSLGSRPAPADRPAVRDAALGGDLRRPCRPSHRPRPRQAVAHYLKIFARSWVASLQAAPLTPAEKAAADQL